MSDQVQDGCPEFDERLMDLAVQPVADPLLEAHLAICERCRHAHEQYLDTARVVSAAFTLGPPPARRRSLRPVVHALAATILAAAGVLLAASFKPLEEQSSMSVHPEEGTTVHLRGPGRAVIESGTSTFVIRDPEMVVETPAGLISCDNCEFTVQVEECEGCMPVVRYACEPEPMCVTLFVAAGLVGGDFEDQRTAMGPGETLTWSIPGRPFQTFGPTP
ncbi:MAG: hypothetical protein V2A76_11620 [Planctomycetota bacterium]